MKVWSTVDLLLASFGLGVFGFCLGLIMMGWTP